MTKQDLINRSLTEIDKLKNDNNIDTSELDFYKEFVSKYSPFSIEMLKNISYGDYFKAAFNCTVKTTSNKEFVGGLSSIPYSKIDEDFSKFGYLFDTMNTEDLYMLAQVLRIVAEKGIDDKIIESIKDKNKRRGIRSMKELLSSSEDEVLSTYFEMFLEDKCNDILPLLEYNKKDYMLVGGLLGSMLEMKSIAENDENINMQFQASRTKYRFKLSEKDKNKILDKLYKDTFMVDELKRCFLGIGDYYSKLNKKYQSWERDKAKKISAYEGFINALTRIFNNNEIVNYESIIKKIPDDEIRLEFLKLVYQHNNVLYEDLESTYKELSRNSTVNYLALLKKYDISKDEIDLSKVMKNDYDEVERLLKIIVKIVEDKDTIIKAIQVTDMKTCEFLKMLKDRGALSVNSFIKYSDVFDPNSSTFKILDENIKTLNSYSVNPTLFINNSNILLECDLKEKLSVLDDYKLIKSMKNNGDYSYLAKDNLEVLIDKIIELGYERYLADDLTLLNEDNWDRVYVLKTIGETIKKKSDLLAVLRDNDFLIPDSKVDKYVANVVPCYNYNDSLNISVLNDFNGTERAYNINGVIISKNRFRRNYNNNEKAPLLKNLVDGGIYNRDEVELIEKSITETKQK